jgi:hypothetical protein
MSTPNLFKSTSLYELQTLIDNFSYKRPASTRARPESGHAPAGRGVPPNLPRSLRGRWHRVAAQHGRSALDSVPERRPADPVGRLTGLRHLHSPRPGRDMGHAPHRLAAAWDARLPSELRAIRRRERP